MTQTPEEAALAAYQAAFGWADPAPVFIDLTDNGDVYDKGKSKARQSSKTSIKANVAITRLQGHSSPKLSCHTLASSSIRVCIMFKFLLNLKWG